MGLQLPRRRPHQADAQKGHLSLITEFRNGDPVTGRRFHLSSILQDTYRIFWTRVVDAPNPTEGGKTPGMPNWSKRFMPVGDSWISSPLASAASYVPPGRKCNIVVRCDRVEDIQTRKADETRHAKRYQTDYLR